MSSILTNTSAMVALQSLKNINKNMSMVQAEISTGKSVGTAKDNAAVWAISKVMESDVKGFKGIGDSLSLGSSTISVARQAAETVTDLLTEVKGKIVAAQEGNVDRGKIQTDITALRAQIASVVGGAQFNGLNMIRGTADVNILSSLDRANNGSVTSSNITVSRQDLSTAAGIYGGGTSLTPNAVVSNPTTGALDNVGNTAVITMNTAAVFTAATAAYTIGGVTVNFAAGDLGTGDQDAAAGIVAGRINALGISGITASATGAAITISSARAFEGVNVQVGAQTGAAAGTVITAVNGAAPAGPNTATNSTVNERALNVTFGLGAAVKEGDGYRASFAGGQFSYIAGKGENFGDVARGLKAAIDGARVTGVTTVVAQNASTGAWSLKIDNASATATTVVAVGNEGGEASGGLFGLDGIDVTSVEGANAALSNVETMINKAIDSSAAFGSAQMRIDIQNDFVGKLTDALTAGIGQLIDADMEEASARLQALQVQQQLGVQALSIANQAPQSLLSLFR